MVKEIKPQINPAYTPLEISENEVHFRVGPFKGAKHTVSDQDGDGVLLNLIKQFDGTKTVDEIANTFDDPEQSYAAIEYLFEKNVLIDASNDETDSFRNYSLVSSETTPEQVNQARDSSIGIIARGQIGRMVASDLSNMGLDEVLVKDIEIDQSGEFSDNRLTQHNGDIEPLINTADHVVYTTEAADFETAKNVNSLALENETPFTAAHILGMEGIVGPTIIPGKTPCYQCLLNQWRLGAVSNATEESPAYFEEYLQGPHRENFHLPSHRHLVAGVLVKELVTHLLTGHGYFSGRTFDVDFLTMEFDTNELFKYPRCDICGVSEDHDRIVGTDVINDG